MDDALRPGELGQLGEFVGVDVAADLQVLLAGREVLAEGQDRQAELAERDDDLADFVELLAEPEHHAGLGQRAGFTGVAEHGEAAIVAGLDADLATQARHRLEVVGEHVGRGPQDRVDLVELALEVGHQHLDGHRGRVVMTGFERARPDARATVVEVVTIDRGDDGVLELELGEDRRDSLGLALVDRQRPPGRDVAEATRASADVAEDHDRQRAVVPALADVGAARALADRVELELLDPLTQLRVADARRHRDLEPLGVATTGAILAREQRQMGSHVPT